MGSGAFFSRSVVIVALLLGVLGCEDRSRPEFIGTGNGVGPLSQVTAPAELDTVHLGTSFFLAVRVADVDGVDSVWVTLSDTNLAGLRFSGSGQEVTTAGYSVLLPASLPEDTLVVSVQGVDQLGDTGTVFLRHLIVQ